MPYFRNNKLVVDVEELVPSIFSYEALMKKIQRYKNKDYGIKRFQRACLNNNLLIEFDSLDIDIQNILGDPRKVNHILERYYKTDGEALKFFASYSFEDGSYLEQQYQERYIINASVLKAIINLRADRVAERKSKGGTYTGLSKSLWKDAISFQDTLQIKFNEQHTLPSNERRFKDALKAFEKHGYKSLISAKHKNTNSKKVTDQTLDLLKSLFADDQKKPTATKVYRIYNSFIAGNMDVINHNSGELYNPNDFKKLSDTTVKNYMATWENAISTHQKRSGNRQVFMSGFKPYHTFEKPKFAGSIISIDDRQPPFKMPDGNRVWFYNGIDLASEAFVCWVYGKTKEGIILEFYRQLVRNFTMWGLKLPAELEAEMSLNSSYTTTFLRPGAMFEHVKIEANNARGKRIERYFGNLRYDIEREREGWLARPHAKKESNQAGPKEAKRLPYDTIVHGCLKDIENWNNQPHSVHTHLSRWEVFTQMQNPDLKETQWQSFLPYIGNKTKTTVNTGIIKLNNGLFILGYENKIATGNRLINLMKQVEGSQITVYWLDDNKGQVLKALVFEGTRYVCEAVAKPKPQRAKIEQTPEDLEAYALFSAYENTISSFGNTQRKAIDKVTVFDNTPKPERKFVMPGLEVEPGEFNDTPIHQLEIDQDLEYIPKYKAKTMFDTF
jgi:hypothetical protein